jgi:hypothetical protein
VLNPEALEAWCQGIGVPPHARAMIDRIRTPDPARRVSGGRSNVSGRYPSRKMGVTIEFESHRVELAGIYEMEHDAEVLEFYDQPISRSRSNWTTKVPPDADWAFSIHPTSSSYAGPPPVGRSGKPKRISCSLQSAARTGILQPKTASGAARRVKRAPEILASITESVLPVRSTGCTSGTSSSWRTTFGPTCQSDPKRRNTCARSFQPAWALG